jgi:hypothetical protein
MHFRITAMGVQQRGLRLTRGGLFVCSQGYEQMWDYHAAARSGRPAQPGSSGAAGKMAKTGADSWRRVGAVGMEPPERGAGQ